VSRAAAVTLDLYPRPLPAMRPSCMASCRNKTSYACGHRTARELARALSAIGSGSSGFIDPALPGGSSVAVRCLRKARVRRCTKRGRASSLREETNRIAACAPDRRAVQAQTSTWRRPRASYRAPMRLPGGASSVVSMSDRCLNATRRPIP